MTAPRVSVCIATYNHERYVHDCVMSVVAQANEVALELLIGDDMSDDRTGEIAQSLAARFPDTIYYFRRDSRMGGERNYQLLIERARGEYVCHLDGDDYWLPGKLALQVALMDSHPEFSASYTNALCIDDQGRAIGIFNNPQPAVMDFDYLLSCGNFLNNSSVLYRASSRKKICDWPPDFADYKINLMLGTLGDFGYLNCLGTVYRMNSSASMIRHHGERVKEAYWRAIQQFSEERGCPKIKAAASADFLRRLIFRSVRIRSFGLLGHWWPIISAANEGTRVRLVLLTTLSVLTAALRELLSRVAGVIGGTNLRVIYWR